MSLLARMASPRCRRQAITSQRTVWMIHRKRISSLALRITGSPTTANRWSTQQNERHSPFDHFPPRGALARNYASSPSLNATTVSSNSNHPNNELPLPHHFRKVLIANRGEISIRVARTCRGLGIPTVAVYASNDAGSKHVREADESYCLGSSSTSYTDAQALKQAIVSTGADAVHPGYGFLSENADFARMVQELAVNDDDDEDRRVTWLGPPAQAIVDMGCKLRSKEIARQAGVAIIPGCDDGALESVEEALELVRDPTNSLHYPVLLKAAAGGGGKGMRICRTDKELIEGYPLAESEGQKFFADGRLLVEQYLEDPHHIEFQVVCSKTESGGGDSAAPAVDVAIFAERECSVQRRNQKVVEESPSCLLTEETRREMMQQTALLCQTVGYEGAGTVEWLVVDNHHKQNDNDDDAADTSNHQQSFYFLEMNTRLQVEHPITEAVSHNVDLVEAMLEVGSGAGLPQNWYETAEVVETPNENPGRMLVMPWEGHAIEGRIYAEDPRTGYLPSTGPLVPYKEPSDAVAFHGSTNGKKGTTQKSSSYLRLDSGVVEGHVVTPFYDPMLSKIISYAPTRDEAIRVLSDGLDSYVIEGVKHNAKLVQAVLRHPSFRSGRTPTSFLEDEIPDFAEYQYPEENSKASGNSLLSVAEEEELAAAVAAISKSRERLFGQPPVVGKSCSGDNDESRTVVVRFDGLFGSTDAFSVTLLGDHQAHVQRMGGTNLSGGESETRTIAVENLVFDLERYLAKLTLDGTDRIVQVLGEDSHSGALKVQMCGADFPNCLVLSPREHELSQHMLPPLVEDTSDWVMSPMPGTLIGFSGNLSVGDSVKEGQELCVVEAMKMQNIIRAPREGIVSKLCVAEGAALVTDQVILEFEAEEENEPSAA